MTNDEMIKDAYPSAAESHPRLASLAADLTAAGVGYIQIRPVDEDATADQRQEALDRLCVALTHDEIDYIDTRVADVAVHDSLSRKNPFPDLSLGELLTVLGAYQKEAIAEHLASPWLRSVALYVAENTTPE